MKREIKFRAWDKRENKMLSDVEGFHVIGEVTMFGVIENHCQNTKGEGTTLERLADIELMQFTGLKDKNRKERYDGDIIRRNTGYVFVEEKKWFSLGDRNNAQAYGYDCHPDDEIIGNIWETPELITKQNS